MLIVILGITGLGSGLFQAPNTAALMAGVPHDRRGIAGSLRTTLQNTGQMISVSVCLAIVAAAVPTSAQGDVVAGTGGSLLGRTVDGFRWAFLAMSFVCVVGGVTSAARGSRSR
jgi:MFS family permease